LKRSEKKPTAWLLSGIERLFVIYESAKGG
jgi:hypothetical protein